MSNAIWKYTIGQMFGDTEIDMPTGARILSVGNQNENICVWAAVDADVWPKKEAKVLSCFLTGPSPGSFTAEVSHRFLGTVLLNGGCFVVHVFEKIVR